MIITIVEENGYAVFRPKGFFGDRFRDFRNALEGSKYDGERKLNYAPVDKLPTILARLREADFDAELSPEMAKRLKEHTAQMWVDLQGARERLTKIDEELAARGQKLYPFQRSGVQWLATRMGALLADDMGLGKTIQAICALPAGAPVIIACPSVAKGVWLRELKRFRPQLVPIVLEGLGSFRYPRPGEAIITNYDILPPAHKVKPTKVKVKKTVDGVKRTVEITKNVRACEKDCPGCLPFLKDTPPGLVVISDEGHALKNGKALRTERFRAIGDAAREKGGRTWILTATPLLNRPNELWAIYQAGGIAQEAFGSWKGFAKVFQGKPGMWGGYEWGTPLAEAGDRIRRVCLRRLKTEVLKELPPKTWRDLTVEIDKKTLKKCDAILKEYGGIDKILELVENGKLNFENLSNVRHALAVAKIPALLEMIGDYEEQEEPVVVFSAHRAVVEELAKRPGWRVILGGVSAEERTEIQDLFQAGKLKGVAATIAAGGTALTLTRSSQSIFTDREWTPALNAQAEDRICRIGQTRGAVITILRANHALDERIDELLLQKQQLISVSVDAARSVDDVPERDTITDEDIDAMVRQAEEEMKHAAAPKKERPKFRPPATVVEEWVAQSLRTLAGLDPDRAGERNDVGFNSSDGGFGHSLASQLEEKGGLSDMQYRSAAKFLAKYHRQIGKCPEES